MTTAQEEALRRAAAATEPVKIHTGTAQILADRYGYITAEGDGWIITPKGRAYINGKRAEERHREVKQRLTPEDRKWAKRVLAWMEAHERLEGWTHSHKSHAEHVAACDHAKVEPVPLGQWAEGAREHIERAVRSAARCLADFDKTAKLAVDRGVGVEVHYEAEGKVPRSRREAAAAASQGSVVNLSTYRERRPGRGPRRPRGTAA